MPEQFEGVISPQIAKLNAELRQDCAHHHSKQKGFKDFPIPDLFRYGIGYASCNPTDAARTILFTGLSYFTTISDVLSHVRGGLVIDAKVVNTTRISGSRTALITFLDSQAANLFYSFAQSHLTAIRGTYPIVSILGTPTYPTSTFILKLIAQQHKTRCIAVHNFPPAVSASTVHRDLCFKDMKVNGLESMRMLENRILELRFTSVQHAYQAGFVFSKLPHYRGCTVKTIADPCAGPLEELLKEEANPIAKSQGDDGDYTIFDKNFSVSKLLGLNVPSTPEQHETSPEAPEPKDPKVCVEEEEEEAMTA